MLISVTYFGESMAKNLIQRLELVGGVGWAGLEDVFSCCITLQEK